MRLFHFFLPYLAFIILVLAALVAAYHIHYYW